jgi:hypothetical protein
VTAAIVGKWTALISKACSGRLTALCDDNIGFLSDQSSATQQLLQYTMPVSIFDPDYCTTLTQNAMDAYAHAMQAYALSQISVLVGLSENNVTSSRVSDSIPTSGVINQVSGLTNKAKTEEAANDAGCTQA